MTPLLNIDLHTQTSHNISVQYPSHRHLPEKSCPSCLRILIMSLLFKDRIEIMKEIMPWLFSLLRHGLAYIYIYIYIYIYPLYPLKTSENLQVFWCFQGIKISNTGLQWVKDPIVTATWLNFDHTQSKIKKWSKKIKLPQMRFFL